MHDTYPSALDLPVPYTLPSQDMPVDYYPDGPDLETLRRSATTALHTLMDATERESWGMATEAELDRATSNWTTAQDRYHARLVDMHQS